MFPKMKCEALKGKCNTKASLITYYLSKKVLKRVTPTCLARTASSIDRGTPYISTRESRLSYPVTCQASGQLETL